jgi:hypothetical protein
MEIRSKGREGREGGKEGERGWLCSIEEKRREEERGK